MSGLLGVQEYSFEDEAQLFGDSNQHPQIAATILAGAGVVVRGTILGRDVDDEYGPLSLGEAVEDENIGTGNAVLTRFTATLAGLPKPGSVAVTDGIETFTDNALGGLMGSAGGQGLVDYATGKVAVQFAAAPADEQAITANYTEVDGTHEPRAILVNPSLDATEEAQAGDIFVAGVYRDSLLTWPEEISDDQKAEMKRKLQDRGIFII